MPADFSITGVSIISLLLAVLVAGSRGAWYFGRSFTAVAKDRDDWKALAQSATATAAAQAEQISKLTEVSENLAAALGQRTARR